MTEMMVSLRPFLGGLVPDHKGQAVKGVRGFQGKQGNTVKQKDHQIVTSIFVRGQILFVSDLSERSQ